VGGKLKALADITDEDEEEMSPDEYTVSDSAFNSRMIGWMLMTWIGLL